MKKINIITLGCSKNTVDSERILAQLAAAGYKVFHDREPAGNDIVIINTCGFIGDAKEESINTILACAASKNRGDIGKLYVIGCLSERYREELRVELPEVDAFFGARNITEIATELGLSWKGEVNVRRVLSTPSHYAYLKISEGCDRRCGFCAIPMIRGPHISVPMENLIAETELLVSSGVKELMVIAQDTTAYGTDIYGKKMLGKLLEKISRVEQLEWIRLHYAYPSGFPEDVLDIMASEDKICKYLDIPLQHITDDQLRSMRRGIDRRQTEELIRRIRDRVPGIAIRTTLLTGYPGETEEDFRSLYDFVSTARFERMGVFPYSAEEGTYSGENLPDDVPQSLKEERVGRLMELQSAISLDKNRERIGKTEKVIIDSIGAEFVTGRSQYDSPEVDQEILIHSKILKNRIPVVSTGDFIDVRITGAEEFDLYGEPAGR